MRVPVSMPENRTEGETSEQAEVLLESLKGRWRRGKVGRETTYRMGGANGNYAQQGRRETGSNSAEGVSYHY